MNERRYVGSVRSSSVDGRRVRSGGACGWLAVVAVMASGTVIGCANVDEGDDPTVDEARSPVDALRFADDPVATDPDRRSVPRQAACYPIILMHGFNASADENSNWSFSGVVAALTANGHTVHALTVPPFNSVEVRAREAESQINTILAAWQPGPTCTDRQRANPRVHLITHSMGGLDARYLTSTLPIGARVASVTTMSTPHRGSAVADFLTNSARTAALVVTGDSVAEFDARIDRVATLIGSHYSTMADRSALHAALFGISSAGTAAFNTSVPDRAGVFYESFAGVSSVAVRIHGPHDATECRDLMLGGANVRPDLQNPILAVGAGFLAPGTSFTPNDGMVTVASARGPSDARVFAVGTGRRTSRRRWLFRGCVAADHLDEVGQPHGSITHGDFDHLRFYRNVAYDLALVEHAQDVAPRTSP